MTPDRVAEALAALEAAEKAATPAPWAWGDGKEWESSDLIAPTVRETWEPDPLDPDIPLDHAKKVGDTMNWEDEDAEFIAKFRNAAPALLELARLWTVPAPYGRQLKALEALAEAVLGPEPGH